MPETVASGWHLLVDDVGRSGAINMAIDYTLLLRAQQGVSFLRFYRWDPACLSFGRNEPARRRYDREEIAARRLDTVRRPTGGRAVWHEHEVTYAVAAPETTFGSLKETYLAIHRTIAAGLIRLGARVSHADSTQNARALRPGACFASPVGGEIVANGRKLAGSAQVRKGGAFLQHGSVLLDGGQDLVNAISQRPDAGELPVTSLSAVLNRRVTFGETAEAIATQARHEWPGRWLDAATSPEPDACFSFDDSAWTWRR